MATAVEEEAAEDAPEAEEEADADAEADAEADAAAAAAAAAEEEEVIEATKSGSILNKRYSTTPSADECVRARFLRISKLPR